MRDRVRIFDLTLALDLGVPGLQERVGLRKAPEVAHAESLNGRGWGFNRLPQGQLRKAACLAKVLEGREAARNLYLLEDFHGGKMHLQQTCVSGEVADPTKDGCRSCLF